MSAIIAAGMLLLGVLLTATAQVSLLLKIGLNLEVYPNLFLPEIKNLVYKPEN